jgi:hypothetical protein
LKSSNGLCTVGASTSPTDVNQELIQAIAVNYHVHIICFTVKGEVNENIYFEKVTVSGRMVEPFSKELRFLIASNKKEKK